VSRLLKIAVIIVNWNGGELLLAAVNSVVQQTLPADRILVVDNNSSDGSMESIKALTSPKIEILEMGQNLGFAQANNHAIRLLDDCDWVALLNPDAIAADDWLLEMSRGVFGYPNVKSFASRMMSLAEPTKIDGAGDCYHISGLVWRRFHGKKLKEAGVMRDQSVFGACAGASMYSREAFLEVGGFDEDFFCYCEDVDLAFRLQLRGLECKYLCGAVVMHMGGGTTGSDNRFADYHGHRNLVWVWVKNMPIFLFLLLLPVAILANLTVVIQKTMQGRGRAVVKGKRDGLTGIFRNWNKRKKILSHREISVIKLFSIMSKSVFRH
jgi:GT2 family glycosyltransferase